jgi:hypothetical protein
MGGPVEKEFFKWGVKVGAEAYAPEKLVREIIGLKRVIRLGYPQLPVELKWRLEALQELQAA